MASNFKNLMKLYFLDELQTLENTFYEMFERLDIDSATTFELDGIGQIVGQPRQGMTDEQYRLFLKGRIAVNVSQGNIDRIYQIIRLITDAVNAQIVDLPGLAIDLYIDDPADPALLEFVKQFIDDALVSGVRLANIIQFGGVGFFQFDGDNVGLGFSSIANPTVGGKLVKIIA